MAEEDFSQLKGVVREIRLADASEEFDLAGYSESRTKDMVIGAFSKPLTKTSQPVQFTFVVGGGKLVRARYPDELRRWMSDALKELGFDEDRGGSLGSQGCFKHQHDTGLNLVKVLVYPNVTAAADGGGGSGDGADQDERDTTSPEYFVSTASLSVFTKMVGSKVQSWRQKKRCLKCLQDSAEEYGIIEQKMFSGQVLSAPEQAIYDEMSDESADKLEWLQKSIKEMVDTKRLTLSEKEELLDTLSSSLEAAAEAKQGKKVANLTARRAHVETIEGVTHPLKHADEIFKLRLKCFPLAALEEKAKSNSLTVSDLKRLEDKTDMEASIEQLESMSWGWFEEEEDFRQRAAAALREAKAAYSASKGSSKKASGGAKKYVGPAKLPHSTASAFGFSKGGNSSWASAGGHNGPAPSMKTKAAVSRVNAKESGNAKANSFANAFDSDSDSD